MAEINIEKKKKGSIWPWIIGLLVIVGIIWIASEVTDDSDNEVAEQQNTVAPVDQQNEGVSDNANIAASTAASEDFISYVNDKNVKEQMGADHETTSEALMKLSTALREISGDDQFQQEISQIEENARQIQEDSSSLQHADIVSQTFTNAANVLQQIQNNQYPDAQSDVQEVQEIASKIQEDQQFLDQKENVQAFFEEAAQAIETIKDGMSG